MPNKLLPDQRRGTILELIQRQGGASVVDLAEALRVSESTIRRDLDILDNSGMLHRVRGGGTVEVDPRDYEECEEEHLEEKVRIGQAASKLIKDRSIIILDIGTTTAMIAKAIAGRPLTVVTSSLAVVKELADFPNTEVIILGGVLRRTYHSMVGLLTENALSNLSADIAFIGTSGVSEEGVVMDTTGTEIPVKKAIMQSARKTFLVADSNKFPGCGLLPICHINDLAGVITTAGKSELALQNTNPEMEIITL